MPADFNPFTMPADNDIFMLRDKERQRKKAVSVFLLDISFEKSLSVSSFKLSRI